MKYLPLSEFRLIQWNPSDEYVEERKNAILDTKKKLKESLLVWKENLPEQEFVTYYKEDGTFDFRIKAGHVKAILATFNTLPNEAANLISEETIEKYRKLFKSGTIFVSKDFRDNQTGGRADFVKDCKGYGGSYGKNDVLWIGDKFGDKIICPLFNFINDFEIKTTKGT
jgi:hypothetical protein